MRERMVQLFLLALRNLVGYPLRSFLTALGVVFGVGSVIAMMALGAGMQEALLAALAGEAGFAGRSNLRTWLTGILKHKIVDTIRRQNREQPAAEIDPQGEPADFDALFDRRGHWEEPPDAWEQPESALGQRQFLAALEECLRALPERTARVFMMREHLGLETSEICKELEITATHCWVMLHRARMALRLCLEKNWFAKT